MHRKLLPGMMLAAGLTACGESIHHQQIYAVDFDDPRTTFEYFEDSFYVRLWLDDVFEGLEGPADSIWIDSTYRTTGPYELGINPNWYGQTDDPVLVLEVVMEREGLPARTLHSRAEAPLKLDFEPWTDHAVSAGARIPLGDQLPFEEGHRVAFTVTLSPPEGLEKVTITTVFIGREETHRALKLESLLLGG